MAKTKMPFIMPTQTLFEIKASTKKPILDQKLATEVAIRIQAAVADAIAQSVPEGQVVVFVKNEVIVSG